tara:strand:+ start:1680 stop:2024 length:345 start_codon:yes stop_codon:yes gene_type:complete
MSIIKVLSDNTVVVLKEIGNNTEAEFIAKNSSLDLRIVSTVPATEYGCLKLDGNSVVLDTDAETAAKQEATNADNRAYLKETDWYAIRKSEVGTAIPSDILTARAAARVAIVEA